MKMNNLWQWQRYGKFILPPPNFSKDFICNHSFVIPNKKSKRDRLSKISTLGGSSENATFLQKKEAATPREEAWPFHNIFINLKNISMRIMQTCRNGGEMLRVDDRERNYLRASDIRWCVSDSPHFQIRNGDMPSSSACQSCHNPYRECWEC